VKKLRPTPNLRRGTVGFLLDEFSQKDLRAWQKFSDNLEKYTLLLFYHLEGLREVHSEELSNALQDYGNLKKFEKAWFRLVNFKHSNEFLSTRGSLIKGGRFNIGGDLDSRRFPGFPALYIASDYNTAYSEYFSNPQSIFEGHELALVTPHSFTAVKLSFNLKNIFDLSKVSNLDAFTKIISKFPMPEDLKRLGRSIGLKPPWLVNNTNLLRKSLLASNWRDNPVQYEIPSNPQVFGRLLRNAGMEGVIYPSTKGKRKCMAVFTENLDGSDSFVELADEAPPGVSHTILNSDSWKELSSSK